MRDEPVLSIEGLECYHIRQDDEKLLRDFTVSHEEGLGLVEYLRDDALREEKEGTSRTYLIKDATTKELVCYFSLRAGVVTVDDTGSEGFEHGGYFDTLPGVELSHFARNSNYRIEGFETNGIGLVCLQKFIVPLVLQMRECLGISMLYLFAIQEGSLIKRYEEMGFHRLEKPEEEKLHKRIKPTYDQNCIFMYRKL